jgi:hypothetical protein
MLPDCCYGFGGPWIQAQPRTEFSRFKLEPSIPAAPSSSLSQILERYSTPQKHASSLEPSARSSNHRTHFYPEMIYSVAEKQREPLNEVIVLIEATSHAI